MSGMVRLPAVTAMALMLAALSMMMSAWLFKLNNDRSDDIQAGRLEVLIRSCEEQNARFDATVSALDRIIARAPPERLERARASRDSTVALIRALAPHRDCEQRARSLTR